MVPITFCINEIFRASIFFGTTFDINFTIYNLQLTFTIVVLLQFFGTHVRILPSAFYLVLTCAFYLRGLDRPSGLGAGYKYLRRDIVGIQLHRVYKITPRAVGINSTHSKFSRAQNFCRFNFRGLATTAK